MVFRVLNTPLLMGHLFSTYAKFYEKLTFLTPDTQTYARDVKNVSLFRKKLRTY